MHTTRHRLTGRVLLAACTTLLLTGCLETFDYRHIQDDFNAAVAADNVQSVDALGALTGTDAVQRYVDIQGRLTDAEIGRLDARLRPNAYAIRAVSQWRSTMLTEARESAATGLALPNVANSPRDQIVLTMIPALVIDQQLVSKFKAGGGVVSEADYDVTYPKDFATAAQMLGDAADTVQPGTSDAIIFYVHLQRWRVLQNWRVVISMIDGGAATGSDARARAQETAKTLLRLPDTQNLATEINKEQALVPATDPIRKAMEAIALQ